MLFWGFDTSIFIGYCIALVSGGRFLEEIGLDKELYEHIRPALSSDILAG